MKQWDRSLVQRFRFDGSTVEELSPRNFLTQYPVEVDQLDHLDSSGNSSPHPPGGKYLSTGVLVRISQVQDQISELSVSPLKAALQQQQTLRFGRLSSPVHRRHLTGALPFFSSFQRVARVTLSSPAPSSLLQKDLWLFSLPNTERNDLKYDLDTYGHFKNSRFISSKKIPTHGQDFLEESFFSQAFIIQRKQVEKQLNFLEEEGQFSSGTRGSLVWVCKVRDHLCTAFIRDDPRCCWPPSRAQCSRKQSWTATATQFSGG